VTPNRGMGAFCQITLTSCFYNEFKLHIVFRDGKVLGLSPGCENVSFIKKWT